MSTVIRIGGDGHRNKWVIFMMNNQLEWYREQKPRLFRLLKRWGFFIFIQKGVV